MVLNGQTFDTIKSSIEYHLAGNEAILADISNDPSLKGIDTKGIQFTGYVRSVVFANNNPQAYHAETWLANDNIVSVQDKFIYTQSNGINGNSGAEDPTLKAVIAASQDILKNTVRITDPNGKDFRLGKNNL